MALSAGGVAGAAFGPTPLAAQAINGRDGHLTARPRRGVATTLKTGLLGLGEPGSDGMIQMPSAMPAGPVPLLIFLHGASSSSASAIRRIGPTADRAGVVVVAPDSRDVTWDGIRDNLGPDVVFFNRMLEHVFARLDVDPSRIAIGGFSDGATYALSIGLASGDLFTRVMACSPGFVIQAPQHGRPRVFISHGTSDQVLPINECSRVIVPRLRQMGYDVNYQEFDGRHELPPEIADKAIAWMTAS